MGITENKPWTAQPCLTAMSEEVPEAEGSAALGPSALAPTEHRAQSKSHHSWPDLSISPTTPHCRSSLIPTNPLQLWKQRNIIFHCIFFLRHQKRKTFLCFHRERYISLIGFTSQVKASNPSPARAHLTLPCKTREEHFSLSFFFGIKIP